MGGYFGEQVDVTGSAATRNEPARSSARYEAENATEFPAGFAADFAAEIEDESVAEDGGANEIEERRRLEQLDPKHMLVTELKKAIKFEFPTAPKSGTKTELQIRLANFRSAAKHHTATVYESVITDEELKGWS